MDENLVEALIMAFSAIVFVLALTLTLYMFTKVTYTSEVLIANADTTRFYENVEMVGTDGIADSNLRDDVIEGRVRIVDSNTIVPTLYRYYKENFCVKIYDASYNNSDFESNLTKEKTNAPRLIQVFDVSLEGQVNKAVTDTNATSIKINEPTIGDSEKASRRRNFALIQAYNVKPNCVVRSINWVKDYSESNRIYMFGAPWIGSTENTKRRIDYFVSGTDGYINNQYVNYIDNGFAKSIKDNSTAGSPNNPAYVYTERVVSYSYTGDTVETDDGDILVTGAAAKDKIVIIYTIIKNDSSGNYLLKKSD